MLALLEEPFGVPSSLSIIPADSNGSFSWGLCALEMGFELSTFASALSSKGDFSGPDFPFFDCSDFVSVGFSLSVFNNYGIAFSL